MHLIDIVRDRQLSYPEHDRGPDPQSHFGGVYVVAPGWIDGDYDWASVHFLDLGPLVLGWRTEGYVGIRRRARAGDLLNLGL